eukprot:3937972-Rhodomonas_salina.1
MRGKGRGLGEHGRACGSSGMRTPANETRRRHSNCKTRHQQIKLGHLLWPRQITLPGRSSCRQIKLHYKLLLPCTSVTAPPCSAVLSSDDPPVPDAFDRDSASLLVQLASKRGGW